MASARHPHRRKRRRRTPCLLLVGVLPLVWLGVALIVSKTSLSARIYNAFIVNMTSAWYRAVFEQLPPNTVVLDVGIGTARALVMNADIIQEKNLTIYGVDISSQYIKAAQQAVVEYELTSHVQVACHSIYDVQSIQEWLQHTSSSIDVVYFSGSFSLLPDPLEALLSAQQLLAPNGSNTIYITQTYASTQSQFGKILKPLIKCLTTIDFGQLVSNGRVLQVFQESNLTLVSHSQLQQTNALGLSPPAFVTILKVPPPLEEQMATSTCSSSKEVDETCSATEQAIS